MWEYVIGDLFSGDPGVDERLMREAAEIIAAWAASSRIEFTQGDVA